jgi:hypothetical protein
MTAEQAYRTIADTLVAMADVEVGHDGRGVARQHR